MKLEELTQLTIPEKAVLYHALLSHVKSGSGYGYANSDREHPAYCPPFSHDGSLGDGPQSNTIYKIMKALSWEAGEFGEIADDEVVASWQSFCELSQKYIKKKCA